MLSIIVAIANENVIGKDNKLIYHFKEDMKFFKEHTMGKKMIMGRKTLTLIPISNPLELELILPVIHYSLFISISAFFIKFLFFLPGRA